MIALPMPLSEPYLLSLKHLSSIFLYVCTLHALVSVCLSFDMFRSNFFQFSLRNPAHSCVRIALYLPFSRPSEVQPFFQRSFPRAGFQSALLALLHWLGSSQESRMMSGTVLTAVFLLVRLCVGRVSGSKMQRGEGKWRFTFYPKL